MRTWFAREALLPEGWANDVRIEVDSSGDFASVTHGASAEGSEALAGPVLPGMANLHSHAFQRAMAGLTEVRAAPDDDFWSWRELMYRFLQRMNPAQAQAVARHLYIEMLKHGYTAVGEFHYVHNEPGGKPYADSAEMLRRHHAAAIEAGIAITLLPSLYRWANFGRQPLQPRQARFDSSPEFVLRLLESVAELLSPDVVAGVAPHSLRAVDPAALRELVSSLPAATPIHIHAAEQTKEVEDCISALGRRPVEWLLENASPDVRWCLVHATHLTPGETSALAKSGATVGLCPTTEGNLGDGIFPLLAYRAAGGRYGIGGDSHVSRDPVEELRSLEYVQRLVARRRNLVVGARTPAVGTTLWLEAAAGGRVLGRRMGAIAPGLRADLVVLDAGQPDLAGKSGDAIANALIFSGATGLVRDVMVGGAWPVRGGRHAGEEMATVSYKKALAELLHNAN
ncbi:MAG: formimidoylglutamate deiminase [Proteobacteria bacterium]|nr:formimidoylglutamate deiminase [Pseudomonadota bacterium]